MKHALIYFSFCCLLFLLIGCGQQGPLYLPQAETPTDAVKKS